KHKAIRLILFTTSVLLIIPALYCLLLLMTRVDTTEEFLSKRSAAYWHVIIWPVALGLFKLSRPPKEASVSTTWLSQKLGERGAAVIETAILISLVAATA